jgi:hypothetical protein
MPTHAETKVKIGDRMILRKKYREMPIDTRVTSTTKCTIHVAGCMETLKASGEWDYPYRAMGKSQAVAYPWSQEMWDELVKGHNDLKEREKKKEEDRERADQERKERLRKEMEEVKETCGGKLPVELSRSFSYLPDGSRLYVLNLPVKEKLKERKKGFQILFIRCKDNERLWREEEEKVEGRMSYVTGDYSCFPSVSSTYGSTDEEVLWEYCRYAYHSW